MPDAQWTYEQPPGGRGAEGLEDYVAYTAEGDPAGKVTSLLEHDGDVLVVVDRGSPPFTHDRRAIPWAQVESVDHASLAVRLRLSAAQLDGVPRLDPDLAVEPAAGEESAEGTAVRTSDLPAEARPRASSPDGRRPADRPYLYAAALGAGLFAVLGLLGTVALVTAGGGDLVPFFLVPLVLGAVALLLAYRLWRRPYEGPR
ncbi:MAG TPA: hypothetical protein VD769_01300 [Gaiellaceae bacterium]|nr:hypothetical protein [Gaiellaceae bacterium]